MSVEAKTDPPGSDVFPQLSESNPSPSLWGSKPCWPFQPPLSPLSFIHEAGGSASLRVFLLFYWVLGIPARARHTGSLGGLALCCYSALGPLHMLFCFPGIFFLIGGIETSFSTIRSWLRCHLLQDTFLKLNKVGSLPPATPPPHLNHNCKRCEVML